jgi:tetratricopeptide (TPR) repeat protein
MKRLLTAGAILILIAGGAAFGFARLRPRAPAVVPPPAAAAPASPAQSLPQESYPVVKSRVEATVAAAPKRFDLRMRAAEFYMRAGDNEAAIPHLEEATKLQPKELLPWIALGDACTLSGKFKPADSAYRRAATIDANNPLLIRGRGQLLVRQEAFAEARKVLEAGLKRYPDDVEIRTALGNLLLVLNKPREVIATLKPAVEKDRNRPDLHLLLADAYERDLHVEAAIKQLQLAVQLDPQMDQAWGRMGLYLVNLTRFSEARIPLQNAIRLNPREAHYYWAFGDSYLLDTSAPENTQHAIEHYRKALEIDPKHDKALYSYAVALTRDEAPEKLEEAAELFKRLLAVRSGDGGVHYKLAETYRRLGRKDEEQQHLARFEALSEKSRRQTRDRYRTAAVRDTAAAHVRAGQEHLARRDYGAAAREFQLALERDSTVTGAREGLREASARLARGSGQ